MFGTSKVWQAVRICNGAGRLGSSSIGFVKPAILLFVKYPTPGRVKTRLAVALGAERAAEIYRLLVARVIACLPVEDDLIVCFDPLERRDEVVEWLAPLTAGRGVTFSPQAPGDLGARLDHAFAQAFAEGRKRVLAVGGDCLEMTPQTFEEVRTALDTHDCAIGPALDGGYYLLALKQPCPALYRDVAWSTDAVFAQTLERARAAGLSVHLLPTLRDVDTIEDWQRAER